MTTLTISTSGIPTIKPTYGRFPVSSYSSTPDPWSSPVEFDISLGRIKLSTGGSLPAATASNVLSSNITGLIAAYEGSTFSGTTWTDDIGTYDTSAYRGTPSISSTQLNGYDILEGTTSDGLQFPSGVLPSTYTLFHVTRYNGTEKRIFDGVAPNWLSGFWGGLAGVAYHDGWITSSSTDYHGTDWVISTDQNSLYRSNGVQRGTGGGGTSKQLGLNYGNYYATESSDWQCAEVIVFNRTLTQTEYEQVEQYLSMKYSLPLNGTVATSWPFGGAYGSSGAGVFVNDFTATWTPPSSYTTPNLSFNDRIKIQVSAENTITYAPKHFRESVLSINNTVPYNLTELRTLDGTRRQYKIARAISSNVSVSSGGGGGGSSAVTDIQTWY